MKTDSQLYAEITDKFAFEPEINPTHITLSVQDGIVTLVGSVKHYAEKRYLERAVRATQGVKGIVNDLTVSLAESLRRNDTDIAKAAINALLWDINVPDEKIKVTVENGNIKLTGEVNWWYQRKNAEKAVRNLMGVTEVDNQIKIKPSLSFISPTEVKEKITKEFERSALIDAQGVHVKTDGSKIILQGNVHSWAEFKEANRAAWSIPGVIEVDNQLTIR